MAISQLAQERAKCLQVAIRDFVAQVSGDELDIQLAREFGSFIDPPLFGPYSWGDEWKFFLWLNHHVMAFHAAPHGIVWKILPWSEIPEEFAGLLASDAPTDEALAREIADLLAPDTPADEALAREIADLLSL